ncbi:MAG: T9SS type A sorting domain-containing protein [Bacteroidetes bacterium]|nr:T9SS type A sorting domain-containing protein [Bacteroidota bacterium]
MVNKYLKIVNSIIAILLFAGLSNAQSFQLENVHGNVFGAVEDDLEAHAYLRNISDQTRRAYVKSEVVNLVSGHETFFCWEECYFPGVTVSPTYIELAPNEVVELFHGYLRPNSVVGVSSVKFTFYSSSDSTDAVDFTAVFDATPATVNSVSSEPALNAFPNPADYRINIAFENLKGSDRMIEIYNMLGVKVGQVQPETINGSVVFNTSTLKPGVYFYMARSGGKLTKPGRFTVKR